MRRHRAELRLTVEHRGAPAPEALGLVLAGDDDVHLEIAQAPESATDAGSEHDEPRLDAAVLAALAQANGPLARAELRARLRVRNERVVLTRLADAGIVHRVGDRWGVPDSRLH